MRRCFVGLALITLCTVSGCGGKSVSMTTFGPSEVRAGGESEFSVSVRTHPKDKSPFRGKVRVETSASPGVTVTPPSWEVDLGDSGWASKNANLAVARDASGQGVVKVTVKPQGGKEITGELKFTIVQGK